MMQEHSERCVSPEQTFGVKLRRVKSSVIDRDRDELDRRRSASPGTESLLSNMNLQDAANKRASMPAYMAPTKASDVRSKVAKRQKIAEQKAIIRRKSERPSKTLNDHPVSKLVQEHRNSRSMDSLTTSNQKKPTIPPKPKFVKPSIAKGIRGQERSMQTSNPGSRLALDNDREETHWIISYMKRLMTGSRPLFDYLGQRINDLTDVAYRYYFLPLGSADENDEFQNNSHGHRFIKVSVNKPIWCEACYGILWVKKSTYLKCFDCNLNVHEDCQSRLFDSCKGADVQLDKSTDNDVDDADSGYSGSGRSAGFTLTKEEILSRIQTYNESRRGSSCAMIVPMDGDDAFQGAIHVYINLEKPIHMTLKQRPTSIYDALDRTTELSPPTSPENTLSACTLPIDAPVSLHVKSTDRASNVVEILLKKFKITDHPKDFALYEQSIENEQEVKLRKIGDVELPLLNYLRWSTENLDSAKRFVLKEHNSADILWEAFSLPELNNFITMFQIEEQQAKQDIIGKYNLRRTQLQHRLSQIESEQKTAQ